MLNFKAVIQFLKSKKMIQANLTVYLQALGAHYLGAHAYDAEKISVQLNFSGGLITIPYLINQNDGIPTTNFVESSSSFMPIITAANLPKQPTTLVHFLSHNNQTACAKTVINLPKRTELAKLKIIVPITTNNAFMEFQQPLLLSPNKGNYSITVVIPGLYLSKNEICNKSISVFVKMMCGCPVTAGPPASLWPNYDFEVSAIVTLDNSTVSTFQLNYVVNQKTNSLFGINLSTPLPSAMKSVRFIAKQKSTGNYGELDWLG
jgi:hypothetical protein